MHELREEGWVFGPFEISPPGGWLLKDGVRVPLAAKPFAILVALVRRSPEIVPREALLSTIWSGVAVSVSAFESAVRDLRRALGDDASAPRYVETVKGKGLRLCTAAYPLPGLGTDTADSPPEVWEAAAAHLQLALVATDRIATARGGDVGPAFRSELTLALARATWAAGDRERARATFLEAGEHDLDPARLAAVALGLAGRTDATPGVDLEAVRWLESALERLTEPSTLRVEVRARLGTELYYEADGARSLALTAAAVEEAESLGDEGALAYALTARHYALTRVDVSPEERLALTIRAEELLHGQPAAETLAIALQERLVDQLEVGDGAGYRETLERYAETVSALGQPFFEWMLSAHRGRDALLAGDFEGAESAFETSLALGRRCQSPNALLVYAAQMLALRLAQGRAGELMPLIGSLETQLTLPVVGGARCAIATLAGETEIAETALGEAMSTVDELPRDHGWLATLALYAIGAFGLRSEEAADILHQRLAPFADRCVLVAYGMASLGAVPYYLGLLAHVRGRTSEANEFFDAAKRIHRDIGVSTRAERL